jgi:hypothetical protein
VGQLIVVISLARDEFSLAASAVSSARLSSSKSAERSERSTFFRRTTHSRLFAVRSLCELFERGLGGDPLLYLGEFGTCGFGRQIRARLRSAKGRGCRRYFASQSGGVPVFGVQNSGFCTPRIAAKLVRSSVPRDSWSAKVDVVLPQVAPSERRFFKSFQVAKEPLPAGERGRKIRDAVANS